MSFKKSTIIVPLGLLSLTVLSGAFLMSSYSYATDDNVVDNININVPISCSMEGTGMTSHNANIVNGTYQANIGTTTIKAYCNDSSGFAIYAIGYTDDEYGKNVLTNTTLGSTADIVTGTATSGSTSNWAMKLTAPTSPTPTYPLTLDNSFGNYHAVPSEYTKVAHRDSATDIGTSAEGSTLTTTYAAFMSQTQPAGTYIGQVRYTLVHPTGEEPLQPVMCESGRICYYPNGSTVIGIMGKQAIDESTTSATLLAPNYHREGYGFAGWNDAFDYSGNYYGPNEDISFTAGQYTGTNDGLSFYAVWIKSAGSLQNWDGCGSMEIGDVTALTDERDHNTYAVAKLADNKCWMIENLRLNHSASENFSGSLAQGYDTSFMGLAEPEITTFGSETLTNSLYSADGSSPGPTIDGYWQSDRFPRYNNYNTAAKDLEGNNLVPAPGGYVSGNPGSFRSLKYIDDEGTYHDETRYGSDGNTYYWYSYGNYYTWPAAVANTNDLRTTVVTQTSICPSGWHIPRGGDKSSETTNEYWALIVTGINNGVIPANYEGSVPPYYTGDSEGKSMSDAIRAYPNNFVLSGRLDSFTRIRGESATYWSSTSYNGGVAYSLLLSINSLFPGTYRSDSKSYGFSIRCVIGL